MTILASPTILVSLHNQKTRENHLSATGRSKAELRHAEHTARPTAAPSCTTAEQPLTPARPCQANYYTHGSRAHSSMPCQLCTYFAVGLLLFAVATETFILHYIDQMVSNETKCLLVELKELILQLSRAFHITYSSSSTVFFFFLLFYCRNIAQYFEVLKQ